MIGEFYRRVVEASGNALVVVECGDAKQPIVYANPAFERLIGYTAAEIVGHDWRRLCSLNAGPASSATLDAVVREQREQRILLRGSRNDGAPMLVELHAVPLRDERGIPVYYVGVLRDVTSEQRDRKRLVHRACHDPLTGLPNRYLLHKRLNQAIAREQRDGGRFAVVFLDLDGFKPINDTYGHDTGDKLLKCVAARLASAVRDGDTVARFGGDEFVLVIGACDGDAMADIVMRVATSLQRPFEIDGYEIAVSCSIGLSVFPIDGLDAGALLRKADRAMYGSKATLAARNRTALPTAGAAEAPPGRRPS
jgi:diguanylate cyclase (GGDEF)-like protein/PAS domain S-box-containing protein